MRRTVVVGACIALCFALPIPPELKAAADPLPRGWPKRLQLGLSSPRGDAARSARTRLGFRYQYLAGGALTGEGWATWNEDGHFVTYYIEESMEHSVRPVFSYYMLQQSPPGGSGEKGTILENLKNEQTMRALYEDLKLFFERAGAFDQMVVLHVEPDLWGYVQQEARNDDASSVGAAVASTGLPELQGLPDTVSGFARAVVELRDLHAPNVVLGYPVSIWGTGVDISLSDPDGAEVDRLARRATVFYKSLDADFDIAFGEFDDRDAGFNEEVLGDGGASWWKAHDFRRHVRFLAGFTSAAGERMVLWQIPLGNTKMRAMNNTWGHYQDNRPQWLLGGRSRRHLRAYIDAGVVALLFGGGAAGTTCACDAQGDGVTNPRPINGNDIRSFNSDDDGGYFRNRARLYYRRGALRLR
ncbi:MAG: hypothetical protein M3277_03400 [Actinomycetota bacterium]|nr:hypothetical protein [Actinomycetota bacterium]